MHARVFTPSADAAHTNRLAEAPADVAGPTAVDSSGDPSDPGAACRRKTTPLVAFVGARRLAAIRCPQRKLKPRTGSTGSGAPELESSRMPHIDVTIVRFIVASLWTKVVELQPMSLIRGMRNFAVNRGDGWAHFGHTWCPQTSILVNHN